MAQKRPTSGELRAYEKMPVPFCIFLVHEGYCDPIAISDGFCRLLQAERKYFSAPGTRAMKMHMHPDDYDRLHTDIQSACFDPDGAYSAIYRVRKDEDSQYRWISGKGHISQLQDGSYLLYAFYSDIQDETVMRREAAADKIRQDALLSDILSTTKTAIFWKDTDRRFLGANKAFLDYYGFADEGEIIGRNDEDMGWHTEPDPYKNDELRVLNEGISTSRVPGTCIARGENRHIVASKSPLVVDGKTVGLVGSFEDVTDDFKRQDEVKRLNAELERRVQEHDRLMSISQVCIVKIDLGDYTLAEYNDAMCHMVGLSREEYETRYHHDMKLFFTGEHVKELDKLKQAIEAAIAAGETGFSLNLCIPAGSASRWISGAASFDDTSQETGRPRFMYAVYRDTTDIYEAQQKLAQAEVEAQRIALMEERFAKMRLMLDSVPSGLAALRIENGVPASNIQMNRYFTERVALPVTEDALADLHEFPSCLHPDDRERCKKDFKAFLQGKKLFTAQYRFRSVGGYYYWGSVRATIVRFDDHIDMAYFIYTNIDEMKEAEMRLRESRENYQRTVDALQIGMWTYDIPGRRIVMGDNAATEALRSKYGWPKAFENVPESQIGIVEKEDRDKYLAMFREVEAGHDASCDVWYEQAVGIEPHCERESYHVVFDEAGNPAKAYGVGMNVTAAKKVGERYKREVEYLRNNSDESLIAKGHYNLTRDVVLEYEARVGKEVYTFEPGIPYTTAFNGFLDLSYSEEDRSIIADKLDRENLIHRYQQDETQTTLQYRRAVEDHDPIWISMTVHTYMQPENGDLELFSYAYDISRRKLVETVMELVSESAFDYIGVVYASEGTFEILEKTLDSGLSDIGARVPYDEGRRFVDKSFENQAQQNDFDEAIELETIVREMNANNRYTTTVYRTAGEKTYCKKLDYLWFDKQSGAILVICSDVTASFERDQQQIARIEAAKLEAEKANEAKSTFLSSMSHDLRTPLNGVLGFTGLALDEPDVEKKQEYLRKIDSSGRLLLDLINDTLELSRIESGKIAAEPEAVMPDDLAPVIVTALRPSAELKGIHLDTDFPDNDGMLLWCDKLKVQKVILNLVSNAIKYTPEGGTVLVRLAHTGQGTENPLWTLCVEDNGIGMSKEFMERMFEPFSQEKRSESIKTPGTGLGLSIVKRYVDLMDGTIEVDSEIHKGTKWTISLPISEVSGHATEKQADDASNSSLAGMRVLLCEDNYMNTEIAVMILKEKDIQVDSAENGSIGVDLFSSSDEGYYDAVLMDFRMPVMDGFAAAQAIRALDRADATTVPIIAMTADAFDENIRAAEEAGMDGYVTKPIEPQKLYTTLSGLRSNN